VKVIAAIADLAHVYDLVVVGAGPAGLAAATLAAEQGLDTLLADENLSVGGQIYKGVTQSPVRDQSILGADYRRGAALADALKSSRVSYIGGATAWSVAPAVDDNGRPDGLEVGLSLSGAARMISARHVIGATGALERPFPIPGWTLPGVMTAGAAQIALKTAALVPNGRVVVAGSGPLLYLLVAQLRSAGARIAMALDTTPLENWRRAARYAGDFLRSPYLLKGLKLLAAYRGLDVVRGVTSMRADGAGFLREVHYTRNGVQETVPCDVLLLHQGVVPNINLASAVGCVHDWDEVQLSWRPRVNEWFETTTSGFSVAGDGAGIAGAEAAALRGRLAALGAATQIGKLRVEDQDRFAAPIRRDLMRAERGRRFLDLLYKPGWAFRVPPADDTIVCRCEEITAGRVREMVALGVQGPNQMKAFLRCGMGPCQGRLCGLTVTELIAAERGVSPAEVGSYRLRSPIKPVTVGELASLPTNANAIKAVVR
jgi:NADPH-dependent 2,4-dienoyl-CoA reductase/sulfur reductase-like enzyme